MSAGRRWRHLTELVDAARRGRWHPRQLLVLPLLLPLVALGVIVLRGCHTADVPHVKAPPGSPAVAPPTSTTVVDLTQVALAPVEGTTTTRPLVSGGRAVLRGQVQGPDGAVPGAIVRVERIDLGQVTDVVADGEGRWQLGSIAGGRYRVRAFLPPRLAQPQAEVLFLPDGDQRDVALTVQAFEGTIVQTGIAPDALSAGQQFALAVKVATRVVDGDGRVAGAPVVGATATITSAGTTQVQGPATLPTDGSGTATFTLVCKGAASTVVVQVRNGPTDPGTSASVSVPACVAPAPSTTTAPTSSSSSSGGPTSSTTSTTAR